MIPRRLCLFFSKFRKGFQIVNIEEYPEATNNMTIYVVGPLSKPQYAVFKCPCGCGATIDLNLNPHSKPCWSIRWNPAGTLSISPSINRKVGCCSHFFLRKGNVVWCE